MTAKSSDLTSTEVDVSSSMQEYYDLQQELLVTTAVLTGIIFLNVWFFYSLDTALNYLIGAGAGVIYLKMLAKNVEKLGNQKSQIGKTQFISLVGVIILASQVGQLEILPIFLGFLTYKLSVLVYMFRILASPNA